MNVSPMPAAVSASAAQRADATQSAPPQRSVSGRRQAPTASYSPFLPALLSSLGLCGWLGFQTFQLMNDRSAILGAHAAQQQTVDNASRLRASLDALAADTQRLAETGNVNARTLVEELRKRGVTINPNAPSSTLPAR